MHQYTVQFAKKAHLIACRYSHSWILNSGEYFVYSHSSVKGNLLTNLSWPSALQSPTDGLEARCGCSLSRNYWKKVLGYVVPQIRLYQLDTDAVSCKKFQQRHGGEVILHVALSLDVFTSLEDTAELSCRTVCISQSTHIHKIHQCICHHHHHSMEQVGVAVMLWTCILNILSSNFGWDTGCCCWNFLWFSHISRSKCWDGT